MELVFKLVATATQFCYIVLFGLGGFFYEPKSANDKLAVLCYVLSIFSAFTILAMWM